MHVRRHSRELPLSLPRSPVPLTRLSFKRQIRKSSQWYCVQRLSGGMPVMAATNCSWAFGSTGRCLILVLGGYAPR